MVLRSIDGIRCAHRGAVADLVQRVAALDAVDRRRLQRLVDQLRRGLLVVDDVAVARDARSAAAAGRHRNWRGRAGPILLSMMMISRPSRSRRIRRSNWPSPPVTVMISEPSGRTTMVRMSSPDLLDADVARAVAEAIHLVVADEGWPFGSRTMTRPGSVITVRPPSWTSRRSPRKSLMLRGPARGARRERRQRLGRRRRLRDRRCHRRRRARHRGPGRQTGTVRRNPARLDPWRAGSERRQARRWAQSQAHHWGHRGGAAGRELGGAAWRRGAGCRPRCSTGGGCALRRGCACGVDVVCGTARLAACSTRPACRRPGAPTPSAQLSVQTVPATQAVAERSPAQQAERSEISTQAVRSAAAQPSELPPEAAAAFGATAGGVATGGGGGGALGAAAGGGGSRRSRSRGLDACRRRCCGRRLAARRGRGRRFGARRRRGCRRRRDTGRRRCGRRFRPTRRRRGRGGGRNTGGRRRGRCGLRSGRRRRWGCLGSGAGRRRAAAAADRPSGGPRPSARPAPAPSAPGRPAPPPGHALPSRQTARPAQGTGGEQCKLKFFMVQSPRVLRNGSSSMPVSNCRR